MKARVFLSTKMFVLILMAMFLLAGCGIIPGAPVVIPSDTQSPARQPTITTPEAARTVALAYMRTYHPGSGPAENAIWFDETETPEGLAGSSTFNYRYESWIVTVTFPLVAPEATIFTVTVEDNTSKERWQGLVDAYAQVVETFFVAGILPTTAQPTIIPPTNTPTPTATATPLPTYTATPTSTPTPFTPCNVAKFVSDVTIQDGTTFYSGASFTKTWRLKNVGTCTWTTAYDLVFVNGSQMNGNQAQALPSQVKPGESVDISISLKAPKTLGDHQGFWMLRDANGVLFGLGDKANKSFWVSISVVDFNEGSFDYDFALNYCAATWRSETGRLPCPGFTNSPDGFVQLLSNADLENRRENEPTLWVHPNEERYGWIEGTFPVYEVKTNDHFMAWVGCLKGYDRCSLTFYLDYVDSNGKVHRLGEWVETYDGNVTKIDIDLSDLADENVRFILGVEGNTKNVDDAQGFWFVPRIE